MRERCNFCMSEGYDRMRSRGHLGLMIRVLGVLQDLPGMLMSFQVILFPVLLTDTVGVCGSVLKFRSFPVCFHGILFRVHHDVICTKWTILLRGGSFGLASHVRQELL